MAHCLAKQLNETTSHIKTLPLFTIQMRLQLMSKTLPLLQLFTLCKRNQDFGTFTPDTPANLVITRVHPLSPPKSSIGVHPLSPPKQHAYTMYLNTYHIQ